MKQNLLFGVLSFIAACCFAVAAYRGYGDLNWASAALLGMHAVYKFAAAFSTRSTTGKEIMG